MKLKDQLTADMKQAMRDRDAIKLGVLRYLLAEIKNIEIDAGELNEAEIQKVIARQVKQIEEVLSDYERAGREEMVVEENKKAAILKDYLPQQLSDEELGKIIAEIVDSAEEKNMGKIIGQVMQKIQGKADGARVSAMVKTKII